MKILFATYGQIPQAGPLNGHLSLLQKELEQRGHQVDLLAHHPDFQEVYSLSRSRQGAWTQRLEGRSVPKAPIKERVYDEIYRYYQKYLPHVPPWIRWREIERYAFELILSLFDLHAYDLIHAHDATAARAIWRVKPEHIPLVYHCHGLLRQDQAIAAETARPESLKAKYIAAEEAIAAKSCDQAIVPASWLKTCWQTDYLVPDGQSVVIPYGMDFAPLLEWLRYEPYPPVELPADRKVIAYPNGLAPGNGHDTLLAALCILKQQREDFFVWIIGDGPARGELEAFCTANDLERHVQFLGQRPDWPSLLAKTDLVVWPAPAQSIPLPLMEAQVAGKAIVALDAGPLRDAVRDGETGLLFSAGSSHQLASSLLRLLDDSLLAIRLGKEARDFGMRTWSSASWAENIERVYQQAREKRASLRTVETVAGEKRKNRDDLSARFAFRPHHRWDQNGWNLFAERLPISYCLPDLSFLRVLTASNQFDE